LEKGLSSKTFYRVIGHAVAQNDNVLHKEKGWTAEPSSTLF
jgi:hypothetical protein